MTNGMRPLEQAKLVSSTSTNILLGILALGFYWGWIFTCFSSAVMNPFGHDGIMTYLAFLVLAAGISAVSMALTAVLPSKIEVFFRSSLGAVLTAAAAMCAGLPSLMALLSMPFDLPVAIALWSVGMCASTFVYLKTAPFLTWLKRRNLSRCIGFGFLTAALCYLIAQLLVPVAAIALVMLFPVLSIASSQGTEHLMEQYADLGANAPSPQRVSLKDRVGELSHYAPATLIYAVSFGFVSCVVLLLAVEENLVLIIVAAIVLSAVFTVGYVYASNVEFDGERFRRFLMPLIAIAVLPFPYLHVVFKIAFLSVAVFGFTCFDAIGWGDLADEVRDRNLDMFSYMATQQFVGFAGIAVGWGIGFVVCLNFALDLDWIFGAVSVVLVILLILELILGDGPAEDSVVTSANEPAKTLEERCQQIATSYGLTAQETNIFVMLARGRNLKYAAEELCISRHTAKTHIYHIYRKLDVHSQQDLIDMVESDNEQ